MRWVTVASLIGKDLKGMKANVVHPDHRYLYKQDGREMVKNLRRAEYKTQNGHRWIYLYWEPTLNQIDCGYSGWREDFGSAPRIQVIK